MSARRFLAHAINLHGVFEMIINDKSGGSIADLESAKADAHVNLVMRQNEYLKNIVKQANRAVKKIT